MRIRYDEQLEQTIISMKNSRDEAEEDVVWLKGNILSLNKYKSINDDHVFYCNYNSNTGLFINMTDTNVFIYDEYGKYVLNRELQNIPGKIFIEIDILRHEGLMFRKIYNPETKKDDCLKYVYNQYIPKRRKRTVGIRQENGPIFNIEENSHQIKLEFDKTGMFQRAFSRSLTDNKETELSVAEANNIYERACTGFMLKKHDIKLTPVIGFRGVPESKPYILYQPILTRNFPVRPRKSKKNYRKILYSTAFFIPVILGCLLGLKKCENKQVQPPIQQKSVLITSEQPFSKKQKEKEAQR